MSISFGFYNSVNHDRVYDALDMSRIFDGIINDGVFMSIGTALAVTAGEGMSVNVGIGRAWFDHTWTYNDAILPLEIDAAELALTRVDAVVLEVNSNDAIRANTIKVITGPVGATPSKPALIDTATVHQHALAYITVAAGATEIRQGDIENAIGTSETPYITGILETVDADALLLQWDSQFREWNEQSKEEFDEWFENLHYILDGDVAGHLRNQIDGINNSLVNLLTGTIAAGSTSITIEDLSITENSIIDIYFWDKVLAPTAVSVSTGAITIEIDSESTDTLVGVRVLNA